MGWSNKLQNVEGDLGAVSERRGEEWCGGKRERPTTKSDLTFCLNFDNGFLFGSKPQSLTWPLCLTPSVLYLGPALAACRKTKVLRASNVRQILPLCQNLCSVHQTLYVILSSQTLLKMRFLITPCLVETTGAQTEVAFLRQRDSYRRTRT